MSKRQKATDECLFCDGTGSGDTFQEPCLECDGSGRAIAVPIDPVVADMLGFDDDDKDKLAAGTHYTDALGYIRPKLVKTDAT